MWFQRCNLNDFSLRKSGLLFSVITFSINILQWIYVISVNAVLGLAQY